jgi:hypothetical protein
MPFCTFGKNFEKLPKSFLQSKIFFMFLRGLKSAEVADLLAWKPQISRPFSMVKRKGALR